MNPVSQEHIIDDIKEVIIFTRSSPVCAFCNHAKMLLRNKLKDVPVKEFDIIKHSKEWMTFMDNNKGVRTVPQVTFVLKNGEEAYVGGSDSLQNFFKTST